MFPMGRPKFLIILLTGIFMLSGCFTAAPLRYESFDYYDYHGFEEEYVGALPIFNGAFRLNVWTALNRTRVIDDDKHFYGSYIFVRFYPNHALSNNSQNWESSATMKISNINFTNLDTGERDRISLRPESAAIGRELTGDMWLPLGRYEVEFNVEICEASNCQSTPISFQREIISNSQSTSPGFN